MFLKFWFDTSENCHHSRLFFLCIDVVNHCKTSFLVEILSVHILNVAKV